MSGRVERLRLQIVAGENAALIGARMREAREARGWTRRELIKQIDGIATDNDIYRWENGYHRPRDDSLAAIARALGRPLSYFVDDRPAETPDPFASDEPDRLTRLGEQLDRIETQLKTMADRLADGSSTPADQLGDRLIRAMMGGLRQLAQEGLLRPPSHEDDPRQEPPPAAASDS